MCFIIFSVIGKISSFLIIIAHGFISVIIFYLVGEFYHSLLRRLFYFFNSFLFSNFFICVLFRIFFLLNSGIPPSLSFFSEFLGLIIFFNFFYYVFYILFLYFLLSFYYSLFVLINLFIGKNFLYLSYYSFLISFSFLISCFNFIIITSM
jgi:NADH:ubiquinone oxidoreductase subunit 4 (subunit M)